MTIIKISNKKAGGSNALIGPSEVAGLPSESDALSVLAPAKIVDPDNDWKDGCVVNPETGEPLQPEDYAQEVDESAWPGMVDPEPPASGIELTEDSVAKAFIDHYHQELRYDHNAGCWHVWDGARFRKDETKRTFDRVRSFSRNMRDGKRQMSTKRAIEGVEIMASRDPRVAMTADDWNKDPWVLGTLGGYVDLETGETFDPDPALNVSQLTSVSPAEKGTATPHYAKFLYEVTQGREGLQRFLQQYLGYCLTGDTREQVLLFIYGPGGNGKSVLQSVISEIMGDYAKTAAMDTFSVTREPRHLTEIAMLRDARLVTLSETEKGQRWSQARLNQMTGGDNITANFMRRDMFTFRPVFKTFVVGNHKPHLTSVNEAERRRFLIVPFLHKPASPDRKLLAKLRGEYQGILRWAIDGCLDWLKNGLVIPDVVKEATRDYFETEDLFGRWVEECCDCGISLQAKAKDLYESFREFAGASGEHSGSMKSLSNALANAGFSKMKSGSIVYLGIALKGQVAAAGIDASDL
jgi:putative DNA primase/helicase